MPDGVARPLHWSLSLKGKAVSVWCLAPLCLSGSSSAASASGTPAPCKLHPAPFWGLHPALQLRRSHPLFLWSHPATFPATCPARQPRRSSRLWASPLLCREGASKPFPLPKRPSPAMATPPRRTPLPSAPRRQRWLLPETLRPCHGNSLLQHSSPAMAGSIQKAKLCTLESQHFSKPVKLQGAR